MKTANRKSMLLTVRTIAQAAAVLAVSSRQVSTYLERGCPGKPGRYLIPEMIVWCRENVWKVRPLPAPTDDPLMASGDSPELERYRAARASQEEIKLAVMRREFLPGDEVRAILDAWTEAFARSGQRLQTEFGPQAALIHEQTLREFERLITDRWGEPDGPLTKASHANA